MNFNLRWTVFSCPRIDHQRGLFGAYRNRTIWNVLRGQIGALLSTNDAFPFRHLPRHPRHPSPRHQVGFPIHEWMHGTTWMGISEFDLWTSWFLYVILILTLHFILLQSTLYCIFCLLRLFINKYKQNIFLKSSFSKKSNNIAWHHCDDDGFKSTNHDKFIP